MDFKKGKIYLFCQYNKKNSGRNLVAPPAGITWTDYLVRSLKAIEKHVVIVSYSAGIGSSYLSHKTINLDENETIYYLPSLNCKGNSFKLRISQTFSFIQILLFILTKTKRHDKVVLYHDYGLSLFTQIVRKFVKRNYIIVLGEFFSAVYDKCEESLRKEIKSIEGAKGYILANSMMINYVKTINNYCISHGDYTYNSEPRAKKEDNSPIRVVYAGKISVENINDAFIAAEIARYTNGNFEFHILGYGTEDDINQLKKLVDEINAEKGKMVVSYDGCLSGQEYDQFLSTCDIGLCTRTLKEPNCNLCFPSKTLVYLTHGLTVVCPNAEFIKKSKIASLITCVEGEMTSENMANALDKMNFENRDFSKELKIIDSEFKDALERMLNSI